MPKTKDKTKTVKKTKPKTRPKCSTTIDNKLKIIDKLKSGSTVPSIMREYGIGRTTVYDIRKAEPKLREFVEGHDITTRVRMDRPKYEDLDTEVYKWVLQQQYYDIPCVGSYIKLAAERFAKHLNIPNFKASEGWLYRFRERHGLGNKKYQPRNKNKRLELEDKKQDKSPKVKLHLAKNATDLLLKLISSPLGCEMFKDNEYEVLKSMKSKIIEKQCAQLKIDLNKIKKSDLESQNSVIVNSSPPSSLPSGPPILQQSSISLPSQSVAVPPSNHLPSTHQSSTNTNISYNHMQFVSPTHNNLSDFGYFLPPHQQIPQLPPPLPHPH